MDNLKTGLAKVIAKRRLEGGEFDFVLTATGETVSGKKAALNLLKEKLPEDYKKVKEECIEDGETEDNFDARALKLIPSLPYEEVKTEDMEVDEDNKTKYRGIEVEEMFRLVSVSNVDKKTKEEDVQTFMKKFDGVETVRKYFNITSNHFNKSSGDRTPRRQFSGIYNVKFKDNESAAAFLAKSDEEVTLDGKILNKQLLKVSVQNRLIRQKFAGGSFHKIRLLTAIPIEDGELSKCLLIAGIGKLKDTEVKEVLSPSKGFDGLKEVKCVMNKYGSQNKLLGYLLKFDTEASCGNAAQKMNAGDLKHNDKEIRCSVLSEVEKRLALKISPNDLTNGAGVEKQVVLLKLNRGLAVDDIVEKVKGLFAKNTGVEVLPASQNHQQPELLMSFKSKEDALEAISSPSTEISSFMNPCSLMMLEEYVAMRTQLIEESKARMERFDEMYKTMKSEAEVTEDTITLVNKNKPEEDVKAKEKKKEKKKDVAKEKEEKPVVPVAIVPQNPLIAKRKNRGPGIFDKYVGVNGFATPIKNMGVASDIDICNYFLQNHKDVIDVKFFDWTKSVFVKFKTTEAAERFIGLSYVLFYGVELSLLDVEMFFKKRKAPKQKEEMASILLNKKVGDLKLRAEGGAGDAAGGEQEQAATKGIVELAAFASKQAGSKIRERFIEELNLNQQEVGQANWVKDQKGFKATIMVKLDEDAISFLVKKWNDMNITVEGEQVQAAVSNKKPGQAGVKRGNRKNFGPAGKKKPKFNNYENY